MSVQVQIRRGSATNIAANTPAQGEIWFNETTPSLVVGDGATVGGWATAMSRRSGVADAAYAALVTDRIVAYTALTAARTVTLPTAASFPGGAALTVVDETGACSPAKAIKLTPAGTDTLNGAASMALVSPYGAVTIESNGVNGWTSVGGGAAATLTAAAGANGSTMTLNVLEQLVSGLSGASATASVQIPAGALVLACASRTVTAITGATSYEVGYGSGGTLSAFGSLLGVGAGSTNEGVIGPNAFYSATAIVVTAAGGNFTAGAVRLALMYLTFTPPTS